MDTPGMSNLIHLVDLRKVTLTSKGFFCNFNQIQKVITVSKIVMKIFIDENIYFMVI